MTSIAYRVQVSHRAKFPRLKISAREGLVVVIPDGFDRSQIASVVEGKRDWIQRSEDRLHDQAKFLAPGPSGAPPERISLLVVGQDWSVNYRAMKGSAVTGVETLGHQLLVSGDIENARAVGDALRRWLSRKTREHLVPWLQVLAQERGFEIERIAVRSQRTRWASCSAKRTISLNLRLMFLPEELVRYALLHELAHTQEMNHGRRYWTLLQGLEPKYMALDADLRAAWTLVPDWIRPKNRPTVVVFTNGINHAPDGLVDVLAKL
jgi:predicted metal-dependent hydrolase